MFWQPAELYFTEHKKNAFKVPAHFAAPLPETLLANWPSGQSFRQKPIRYLSNTRRGCAVSVRQVSSSN